MNDFEEQDYTKGFDMGLWFKILQFAKKYKNWIILLLILDVIIVVIDSTWPQMQRFAVNRFIGDHDISALPQFIAGMAALTVIQAANIYMFIRYAGKIEVNIVHDVREKGFKKLQELSFSYFDTTAVGWIMARMTSDAQRIGDFIAWGLIDVAWAILYILIMGTFMFVTNWKLAALTLSVVAPMVVVSVFVQRRILKGHREARKVNSKITGSYNEGINGAKTTKTIVREFQNFLEFKTLSRAMRNASVKANSLAVLYYLIMFNLDSLAAGLVLWYGGGQLLQQNISLGDLTVFIAYAGMIFGPINRLAEVISEMQSAQASGERTMSLIDTQPDITDRQDLIDKYGDWENPKPENWHDIKGEVVFENVSFAYKSGETVLKDFNLTVRAGEKIALVGETGAGKSTIVNLICRFYEPTAGRILIDGTDYKERTQIWLHSNLGYVLQSPHLFSGSIKENIRYGKLDATDDEIRKAAESVNATAFIDRLEKGFDAEVGEGGGRLSSGERQLVSFARALIGDPKLFVLDEATSSVDTETEQTIQNAVYSALQGRTSFIVAHRLSTIRSCDRILVIHDGEVVEQGSHRELLRKKGRYFELYTNQFREEAENKLLGVRSHE